MDKQSEKPSILYVDDEHINLLLLKRLLQEFFEVKTSVSASEALDLLENNKDIKAVITDLRMPQMSGMELIREARQRGDRRPFMILSGFEKTGEIEEALTNEVVSAYIQKPYNRNELVQLIEDNMN